MCASPTPPRSARDLSPHTHTQTHHGTHLKVRIVQKVLLVEEEEVDDQERDKERRDGHPGGPVEGARGDRRTEEDDHDRRPSAVVEVVPHGGRASA